MNSRDVRVGQIWDDLFGQWTYKVVAKTRYNVILRRLEYGSESFIEQMVPYSTLLPGSGWRLIK
jgi:hypothetical protein